MAYLFLVASLKKTRIPNHSWANSFLYVLKYEEKKMAHKWKNARHLSFFSNKILFNQKQFKCSP